MTRTLSTYIACTIATTISLGILNAAGFDHLSMSNGKVVKVEGEHEEALAQEVTLNDGTRVFPAGMVVSPGGERWKLSEGDRIGESGKYMARIISDGIAKMDGKVLTIADAQESVLGSTTILIDGTTVTADGKVTSAAGEEWDLENGDMILRDGRVLLEGSVIRRGDRMLLVKDCHGIPMTEELELGSATVMPNGAVRWDDDKEVILDDGDIVKPDGTLLAKRE